MVLNLAAGLGIALLRLNLVAARFNYSTLASSASYSYLMP